MPILASLEEKLISQVAIYTVLEGLMQIHAVANHKNGYAGIITVIVTAAILVSVSISSGYISISNLKSIQAQKIGEQLSANMYGCLELSLLTLRNDPSYTGSSLSGDDYSCSIAVSGVGIDKSLTINSASSSTPQYSQSLTANIKQVGKSIRLVSINE